MRALIVSVLCLSLCGCTSSRSFDLPMGGLQPAPVDEREAAATAEYIKEARASGGVLSPYTKGYKWVRVGNTPPGTEVKCPYTGKTFLVPPMNELFGKSVAKR